MAREDFPATSRAAFLIACIASAFASSSLAGPGAGSRQVSAGFVAHDRVHYDDSEPGTVWARGGTYKASFSGDGTAYIPFLGENAPRNFPVRFRVAEVACGERELAFDAGAPPVRSADSIAYDRGTFVELYELAPDGIEQLFVFPSVPASGDVVVTIEVESELAVRIGGENLEIANEHGSVLYGRAFALDARGASVAVETALRDGAIELRVPSSFVAAARFPLTIDPIISTFALNSGTGDHREPDAAYVAGSNRYLVAYEERFSATDRDIYVELLDPLGTTVLEGYVEQTSAYWANPSAAGNRNANQFLVVAEVGLPTSGARTIRGRTVAASNLALSASFTISGGETGDKFNPDAGGDATVTAGAQTYYCVVWERAASASNHDVHARLVQSNATLLGAGTIFLDNGVSTFDIEPAVSESNGLGSGATRDWNVVWLREIAGDGDVRGAQIHWTGAVTTPAFTVLQDPTSDDSHPDVSSPLDETPGGVPVPRFYLVVCERDSATSHIVMGLLMKQASLFDQKNLNALQVQTGSEDRSRPCVDSDGKRFAVAYAEQELPSATDYDMHVATFTPIGNALYLSEAAQTLATAPTHENHGDIVARYSGGGANQRFLAVWDDDTGAVSAGDPEAGLYDGGPFTAFCRPGGSGVIACPCGNPAFGPGLRGCNNSAGTGGAVLSASGAASIGADTMAMTSTGETPTALSIFNQGTTVLSAGVVFGQGVRCVGGSIKRLYTKTATAGAATAPIGADPSVTTRSATLGDPLSAGTTRYYYVYYRDGTVLGGCPATSTFNVTQAVQAIWGP